MPSSLKERSTDEYYNKGMSQYSLILKTIAMIHPLSYDMSSKQLNTPRSAISRFSSLLLWVGFVAQLFVLVCIYIYIYLSKFNL